jgi:hypothetical protein
MAEEYPRNLTELETNFRTGDPKAGASSFLASCSKP